MLSQFDERVVLTDLANARDRHALVEFYTTWPDLSKEAELIVPQDFLNDEGEESEDVDIDQDLRPLSFLADLLRRLWVADEEAVTKLHAILLPTTWTYTLSAPSSMFQLDWTRGKFSYQPPSELRRSLYYLLQHSDLTRRCGNSDCERPYFIGTHGNDRYCSNNCFVIARKQSKRAWWEEHGEEWRRDRESVKKKNATKKKPRGGI